MVRRIRAEMTSDALREWQWRNGLSLSSGAEFLGVSRRTFQDYLFGRERIPLTLARLCWCHDYVMLATGGQLRKNSEGFEVWVGSTISYTNPKLPLWFPDRAKD
jgi:transcriptional regulator with XRE-family HTH domain